MTVKNLLFNGYNNWVSDNTWITIIDNYGRHHVHSWFNDDCLKYLKKEIKTFNFNVVRNYLEIELKGEQDDIH